MIKNSGGCNKMIRKNIKKWLIYFVFIVSCSFLYATADEKPVELFAYPLKLVVYRDTGNFCLYYADSSQQNVYLPLYSDDAEKTMNIYSVLFDKSMYELNKTSKNKVIIEQTLNKIMIVFQINFDFIVTQTLSFIPSNEYSVGKVLKIETQVKNTSGKTVDIGVKALFDVILSEDKPIPLYTDLRSEIASELILRPELEKDRAIFSGSEDAACMFFLKHDAISTPASVYCANRKRLTKKGWIPPYVSGRSFTRFCSRDVGLLYIWPTKSIPYKGVLRTVNCIGFYDYRRSIHPIHFGEFTGVIRPAAEQSVSQTGREKNNSVEMSPAENKKNTANTRNDARVKDLLDRMRQIEEDSAAVTSEEIRTVTKEADNTIVEMQAE